MQRRFVSKAESGWDGVEREGYAPGAERRVVRNTLVGRRKETASDPGPAMELRYFEVPPGASTRFEQHAHEHVVIVREGRGRAVAGEESRDVGPDDVVYVGPLEPHRFVNVGDGTFGFYCVVPAHRDRPQPLEEPS